MLTQKSNVSQQNNSMLSIQVMDDLTVQVIPHPIHGYLMATKFVAKGYGISDGTIRRHVMEYQNEIKEGTHYIKGVDILNTLGKGLNLQPHAVFWTKRGIIRLSFFIKSERAKRFRDLAEDLIVEYDNIIAHTEKPHVLPEVQKRKHNRLTDKRMIDILSDIAKIDDKGLRLSLIQKLGV